MASIRLRSAVTAGALVGLVTAMLLAVGSSGPAAGAPPTDQQRAALIARCNPAALRETTAYRQMVAAQVDGVHAVEDLCGLVRAQQVRQNVQGSPGLLVQPPAAAAQNTVGRGAVRTATAASTGQWSAPFLPTIANPLYVNGQKRILTAVHLVGPLPTPKGPRYLIFGGYLLGTAGQPDYQMQSGGYLYDPATKTGIEVDPPVGDNIFCGAATLMADGNVLVAGGLDPLSPAQGNPTDGIPVALVFNPTTVSWTVVQSMRQGRWYPTLMRDGTGRIYVIGGRTAVGANNTDVEAFTSSTRTWTVAGTHAVDVYEHAFWLPSGKFAVIGPHLVEYYDPVANAWSTMTSLPVDQYTYPAAVLLPGSAQGSGKMLVAGGRSYYTGPVVAQTSICDTATRSCVTGTPLPQPRSNLNLVYGCDGTLFGIGGNSVDKSDAPQFSALQYVPWAATLAWTTLASQTERRAYHSTAALLPDCSILSAGDDKAGGGSAFLEVFQPPYAFKGARPAITAAPTAMSYALSYPVTTSYSVTTSAKVVRAALIAPNAVTHANDMNERYVPLVVTPTATGLIVTAPPGRNVAPPGPYWLTVVDANGNPVQNLWSVMLG